MGTVGAAAVFNGLNSGLVEMGTEFISIGSDPEEEPREGIEFSIRGDEVWTMFGGEAGEGTVSTMRGSSDLIVCNDYWAVYGLRN